MKPLLIIQHMDESTYGIVGSLLQEFAIPYDIVCPATQPLPDLRKYKATVAFGGPQHVYEKDKHPSFINEEHALRQAVEDDIPYLGICLAGQLLASALGGQVKKHHSSEIGFFDIPLTTEGFSDPLYTGLPGYHKVFHWHEDIFDLPHGGILLASNAHTPNQAFRYGKRAYGLQYHIEITPRILYDWLHDPDLKEEELDSMSRARIEQESAQQFIEYHSHTRIMFTNFLQLSQLI